MTENRFERKQRTDHFTKLCGNKEKDADIEEETNIENRKVELLTDWEINKRIKKLKNRKSPGPDEVHNE